MSMLSTAASRAFAAFIGGLLMASASAASAQSLTPSEAKAIAEDAYIYGYSLITTEVTRVQMSNVAKAEGTAPMGQFVEYPALSRRRTIAVFRRPTPIRCTRWPGSTYRTQVFSHPDMGKRFYLFEMADLWMSDFESPGARTSAGRPPPT